ncbi:MAG: RIP metalloprotease RseP [Okeania sp. SIO3H1]|uniref:RIP metalloprotease RseP n=1 Tax=Okeania sp. SIO1I7 TaxID=2607772 RepID=UPI0013C7BCDD|nr:RIP metalloprotease RseP [Okeania sp. SIO1I7]NEN87708.1 RIP metalloprotease RseP [Okeania sp. SIO3H1]NET24708.1 RIP metalloprotease RseP [Okeania sp. SIO1I7]
MSVLLAIAVLGALIVVHELGHFLAARLQKIHVNRFSIGLFGPVLWKYQGPETEYAIRSFLFGGFVGFPDNDPDSTIPKDDPDLLRNRPILDRAIVLSAGVIANLIFAYFLLVTQVSIIGIPDFNYAPGVKVPAVATDVSSAAAKAGIKANDIILSVNDRQLGPDKEAITTLVETIQNSPNKPLEMELERDGQKLFFEVTPDLGDDGKGRIGVQLISNGDIVRHRPDNIFAAFSVGANEFQRIVVLTLQGFGQLISNFSQTAGQLAGPVAIVDMGAKIAEDNLGELFQFAALISINLAVINILPLPALDGGQLAFLLIEGVRGKPLPMNIQENVMQTGLVVLLGLGIFLIIRDTANLEGVRSLLQR